MWFPYMKIIPYCIFCEIVVRCTKISVYIRCPILVGGRFMEAMNMVPVTALTEALKVSIFGRRLREIQAAQFPETKYFYESFRKYDCREYWELWQGAIYEREVKTFRLPILRWSWSWRIDHLVFGIQVFPGGHIQMIGSIPSYIPSDDIKGVLFE